MAKAGKTRISGQAIGGLDRAPAVRVQTAKARDRELVLAAIDRDLSAWEQYSMKLDRTGRVLLDEARSARAIGNVGMALFALRELQRRAR